MCATEDVNDLKFVMTRTASMVLEMLLTKLLGLEDRPVTVVE